jgi:hypothetical protein
MASAVGHAYGQTAAVRTPANAIEYSAADREIIVTASRRDLVGVAATASQGSVTKKEVELRPIYRIGQFYEGMGLVVTVHSP